MLSETSLNQLLYRENLTTSYKDFEKKLNEAEQLQSKNPDQSVCLILLTKDAKCRHAFVLNPDKSIVRVPFVHGVGDGRLDSYEALLEVVSPVSNYDWKPVGFVTRHGVGNTYIYGSTVPDNAFFNAYVQPSKKKKGDGYLLELWEDSHRPYSLSVVKDTQPRSFKKGESLVEYVETTPISSIKVVVVMNELEGKKKFRLLSYKKMFEENKFPLSQVAFAFRKENKMNKEQLLVERYSAFQLFGEMGLL